MSITKSWMLIIRSETRTIIFAWSLTVSTLVAAGLRIEIPLLITTTLGGYLLSLSIYILSDMWDIDEDRINSPGRPLASGAVSNRDAAILISLIGFAAFYAAFSISMLTVAYFAAAFLLGIFYSAPPFRAKKKFPHKLIIPATGAIVCSLTGGIIVGQINGAIILASIAFAIFSLVTIFLGDVADLKGDQSSGIRSISVLIGAEKTVKVTLILPLIIAVLGLSFYQPAGLNMLFPLSLMSATGYCILIMAKLLGKSEDVKCCRTVKAKMRIMHLFMQLCFIIGVIPL